MDRYDPYTDSFIVDNSNINQFHVRTVQLVELTDECIEKIVNKIAERLHYISLERGEDDKGRSDSSYKKHFN